MKEVEELARGSKDDAEHCLTEERNKMTVDCDQRMAHAVEAREAKMVAALTQLNSQHAAEVFTLRSAHIEELKVLVSQREEKVTAALQAMKRPFESGKAAIEATHAQIFKDHRQNILKV